MLSKMVLIKRTYDFVHFRYFNISKKLDSTNLSNIFIGHLNIGCKYVTAS